MLCRSKTRIDLLFTMSEIPHHAIRLRMNGCEVMFFADDVWRSVVLAIVGSARLRPKGLRRAPRFAFGPMAAPRIAEGEAWWSQTGSNRRPHACKARALPAELWPRVLNMRETVSPSSPHSALKTRVNALNGLRRAHFASSPAWLRHA